MKIWPVQDAKARFSELLKVCLREGPQIVTKRGAEAAVLVPMAEWRRLRQSARPTLKELLLADTPRAKLLLPSRGGVAGASRSPRRERCICLTPMSYLSCDGLAPTAQSLHGCGRSRIQTYTSRP